MSTMLCFSWTGGAVFCSLIILAAAKSVRGNPGEMESSSPYSCCGGQPAFKFIQECENIWDIDNKIIAFSMGSSTDCIPPCKKIENGVMTLDECVDVNAVVVCRTEMKVIVEKRIHYYSQQCSGSHSNKMAPGNQGSAGLSLLAVLIGGLFVKWMN